MDNNSEFPTLFGDNIRTMPQYDNNTPKEIKSLQIPENLQLPVYGFVFLAGVVIGSIFIQSLTKK